MRWVIENLPKDFQQFSFVHLFCEFNIRKILQAIE